MNTLNVNILKYLKNIRYVKHMVRCNSTATNTEKKPSKFVNEEKSPPIGCGSTVGVGNFNISTKLQSKQPQRNPLVKNFFIGQVDKNLLAFPEVIAREDMTKLREEIAEIENYFKCSIDSKHINATHCISKEVKDELKQLGLFGLNISQHLGGKGYFWSESFIATECEKESIDVSTILLFHRVIVDIINELGTDIQKQKFLPKMANGSIVASEAIFESELNDELFNTCAEYDSKNSSWILNGEKCFVVNGLEANLLLVAAQTKLADVAGVRGKGITIFLVDTSLPGVKIEKPLLSFGCRGAQQCKIIFNNVTLCEDDIIGVPNEGGPVAEVLLRCSRLRCSLIGLGLTKNILNHLAEFCIKTKRSGASLADMDIVKNRLSELFNSAYAMESMIYFTVGLLDEFDKQDVYIESSITKYYTIENLWKAASACMEFMGPKCLLSGEPTEIFLRNSAHLYTQGETMDSLRMYIALTGLQHAGVSLQDNVRKERNPLFNPGHIFSKLFQGGSIEFPKSNMQLGEELHPSLESGALCLEQSIVRLKMCVELLLNRYGNEIVGKQVEIRRLTEIVTLIYAMFASLSRASRSYCIGIRLADHEMLTANSICLDAKDRIMLLALDVFKGPFLTNENNLQRISKQIIESRGYCLEHPLTYNY